MRDVVILSLVEGGACGSRVPVLQCADALTASGARVASVVAGSDGEIDEVLQLLDGPDREDGLRWPDADAKTGVIVAAESDSQLRHVLRRMVRRYAPPPSKRPSHLPASRTIPDLPAIGVLPLAPDSLVTRLGLPGAPAEVAAAVLGDQRRSFDLLRHDGGSVTLDGVLIGAADENGAPVPWRGRVEVDDTVLTDGADPIIALCIANAGGYAELDGLPLIVGADPADGRIDVGVAIPVTHKPLFGQARLRYEVRRARGRAVSVTPHDDDLPFLEDGAAGTLSHKRSWWIEPKAWSVYTPLREDEP